MDSNTTSPAKGSRSAPPCYALIYTSLIPVAREKGYALALHGSMVRDLDIVAIPWIEEASDPEALIEAMKEAAEGVWSSHEWDDMITTESQKTKKPHGRMSWSIHLTNKGCEGPYLDVAIMPRKPKRNPADFDFEKARETVTSPEIFKHNAELSGDRNPEI